MLGLSANLGFLWPDRPLLARIDAAAAAGFEAVELHWPYDVPPAQLRDALERRSLRLIAINTPVGDRAGDFGLAALPGREDAFRRAFDQAMRYAEEADAAAIHVMAGVVDPDDRARALDTLIGNLRRAAPTAADAGLALMLEPINRRDRPDYFYDDVDDAAAVVEAVGSAAVRLMFDFYHAGVTEAYPLASFERHLARIGHVQIAAVPSRAEPDEGDLDYCTVFQRLAALGYAGWIGCEYRPRADTDVGLAWREALLGPGVRRPQSTQ